ncbi:MAG: TIM barrel protein [Syntrophobacteraceae bacterium]|jgi:sugar phosphate isomerase/epimerase
MNPPAIAICNFIHDTAALRETAARHGFSGVDWTFKLEDLPGNEIEESRLLCDISKLNGLEVRYHCAFKGVDLGDEDDRKAGAAMEVFQKVCRIVSRLEGRFMTVHLGLGRKSPEGLSWERTISALGELVSYAQGLGVHLCLENLASGWSSRPQLFEKLIRKTGAGITLDIGHARVCQSVQCQVFELEDFVLPHHDRVFNAHIYHEEVDDRHVPPGCLEDIRGRLDLLSSLACDWWVLELREKAPLLATLEVVRKYLENPAVGPHASQSVEI